MKKYVYLTVLTFLSVTIFSSCVKLNYQPSPREDPWGLTLGEKVNTFSEVIMTVKNSSVSPTGLTVILENNSRREGIFSEDFMLEKRVDKNWEQVPVTIKGEYGFHDIGFQLPPDSQLEWTVDWEWLYGCLKSGEYRIIKNVLDFREAGNFDEHHLAAVFILD